MDKERAMGIIKHEKSIVDLQYMIKVEASFNNE